MKRRKLALLFLLFVTQFACVEIEEGTPELPHDDTAQSAGEGSEPTSSPMVDALTDLSLYVFGNDFVVYEPSDSPNEETKVPHWQALLSEAGNLSFKIDGRSGDLRQFADAASTGPEWEFSQAQSQWTDATQSFSAIEYNRVMIAPPNNLQGRGPTEPYDDTPKITPLSATLSAIDQIAAAQPDTPIFIYAAWAQMSSYGAFPDAVDLENYYADSLAGYWQWYLDYHDRLLRSRPELTIKMIPVSLILSRLFTDSVLKGMNIGELYTDALPHGQASLYFLAALIVHSALYQQPAPEDFSVPESVAPQIRDNYNTVVDYIWQELQNFNHAHGQSRVF